MRLITGLCALLLASGTPAIAGFNSWTAESEDDPFSGGNRTTVDYSNDSVRQVGVISGVGPGRHDQAALGVI